MLPTTAISDILSVIQNLFSDISPVVWLIVGVSLGLMILDYFFFALFQRQDENDDDNY